MVGVGRSEDNFEEFVLSFCYMGARDQTLVFWQV